MPRRNTVSESDLRLTAVSYIVLGLVEFAGRATPYDLKKLASETGGVHAIWTVQHAQLYSETERLAKAGYLNEERETKGRRRRHYALTMKGRRAFKEWRSVPTRGYMELRDPGLLQLYFGADPGPLAEAQLEVHRAKLNEYREIIRSNPAVPPGALPVLEAGVGHEREWIRFWSELGREASR